jgi:hypothetical protein
MDAPDLVGKVLIFSGVSVLVILCLTIPLALGMINKRLRTAIPFIPTSLLENLPNLPLSDEDGEKRKGVQ